MSASLVKSQNARVATAKLTLRLVRNVASKSRLRAPIIWFRHRNLSPRDVFIGSYPRSGSTWLRCLLFETLTGHCADFEKVNLALPDVGRHLNGAPLLPGGGRIIKTHEPYQTEYKKAVYLVRDVRDVLISYFSRQNEFALTSNDFNDYLITFLQGKVNGYGSWQDHVSSWLDAVTARRADLLVVRFEDMRRDTEEQLRHIFDFLDVSLDPHALRTAVENNSLERMRERENRCQQMPKANDEDGRFIRRGSVGGWRERLTDLQVTLIQKYTDNSMMRIGYPTGAVLTERADE